MRDGWGRRHPSFAAAIEELTAVAERREAWWGGALPLRMTAFIGERLIPDELVSSVRCIVKTSEGIVRCTNRDGNRFWPGGRREPGETFEETAVREVAEETGWPLDPDALRLLGWLHFEYLTPRPDDWPYPHPDFVQLVYSGAANCRARPEDGSAWSDTEGWDQHSDDVNLADVEFDDVTRPFIARL